MSTGAKTKSQKLVELFREQPVVCLADLSKVLTTKSRMTIYRYLRQQGYFSSFTDRGKYYTLRTIPEFDEDGLWFYGNVGFSIRKTLQETIKHLVSCSEAGLTQGEIEQHARCYVQNALLDLIKTKGMAREKVAGVYLYIDVDSAKQKEQIAKRLKSCRSRRLPTNIVIEILSQVIRLSIGKVTPEEVAKALRYRSVKVTIDDVRQVFRKHMLEKKILD